jgi:hypothetical protein
MSQNRAALFLAMLVAQLGTSRAAAASDPEALLGEMERAAAQLRDYTVRQTKRERFGDRLAPPVEMQVKHSRGRIYLHVLKGGREGAEAIWAPGWNKDRVRVHKGSFPDVTLNLDPHGAMMMAGQHHPIEHATLGHVVGAVLENVRRSVADPARNVRWVGETRVAGRPADVVELAVPYRVRQHVVEKGEDAWSVGKRFGVDAYLVVHANHLGDFDALRAGQPIVVPLYSGTRAVVSLDRATHLPSRLEVYDGAGQLYEQYEWSPPDTTTPITDADFDPANGYYGF